MINFKLYFEVFTLFLFVGMFKFFVGVREYSPPSSRIRLNFFLSSFKKISELILVLEKQQITLSLLKEFAVTRLMHAGRFLGQIVPGVVLRYFHRPLRHLSLS